MAWQNKARDEVARLATLQRINHILFYAKPEATIEWLRELPDMARKLEARLYKTDKSLAEYTDEHTLRSRLQAIAAELRITMGREPTTGKRKFDPKQIKDDALCQWEKQRRILQLEKELAQLRGETSSTPAATTAPSSTSA